MVDLLDAANVPDGFAPGKIEGRAAVAASADDWTLWFINDNHGAQDGSGETQLLSVDVSAL